MGGQGKLSWEEDQSGVLQEEHKEVEAGPTRKVEQHVSTLNGDSVEGMPERDWTMLRPMWQGGPSGKTPPGSWGESRMWSERQGKAAEGFSAGRMIREESLIDQGHDAIVFYPRQNDGWAAV